ncbi:MAG: hypothetical protein WC436_06725 [Candidatus Babeliales bacterium]
MRRPAPCAGSGLLEERFVSYGPWIVMPKMFSAEVSVYSGGLTA